MTIIASPANWTIVPPAARTTGTAAAKTLLSSATAAAGSTRSLKAVKPVRSEHHGDFHRHTAQLAARRVGDDRVDHTGFQVPVQQVVHLPVQRRDQSGLGELAPLAVLDHVVARNQDAEGGDQQDELEGKRCEIDRDASDGEHCELADDGQH
jgi:hypothetical protein